jgi:hypothetical protein
MREPSIHRRRIGKRELFGLLQLFQSMIGEILTAGRQYSRAFKDFRLSFATQWQGR